MARRLATCLLIGTLTLASTDLLGLHHAAFAQEAEMDANGEAEAKEALRLYKQGLYEDAAKIFAKLSVDYPDMLIFERNLGACFYYLRKPEPALSNLRHYLSRKQDIAPDDKVVVERWIDEMEKLREQNVAPVVQPQAPSPAPPPAVAPPTPSSSSIATAAPPPDLSHPAPPVQTVSATSPAVDVTSTPPSNDVPAASSPFYARWWFWGGVGVVAAGAVTTYVLATKGGTENACAGGTLPCVAIK